MQNLIPAEFLGTPVHIVDHDGQKWLTAEEAGRCLGYDRSNARKGVLKIYERHGDEFTASDTFVVKLTANPQGGNPTTRIFSATGCIKLGFFASTPRAKEFRAWASHVLAGKPAQVALPSKEDRLAITAVVASDWMKDLMRQVAAQGMQIERLTKGLLAAKDAELRLHRQHAAAEVQRRIDRVILMEADGLPRDAIVAETGLSFNYVRQIVFRARQNGDLPAAPAAQASLDLQGAPA